jgi:hypothetical protein
VLKNVGAIQESPVMTNIVGAIQESPVITNIVGAISDRPRATAGRPYDTLRMICVI